MTEFKKIQLDDRKLFENYLGEYPYKTYEYSFNTLYMWKDMCNVHYSIIDDSLVVRKSELSKGEYFMPPIGTKDENIKITLDKLIEYQKKQDNMPYLLRDVEEEFLEKLKSMYGNSLSYIEDINNFDYIYSVQELIDLSGKKYHAKKNHYNKFVKSYNYVIKDIYADDKAAEDCIGFDRVWNLMQDDLTQELKFELQGIRNLLENRKTLNIQGMAVYVEDKMVGFSIGEKVNEDMAIIHVEKGNAEYSGIYAFINREFLKEYFSGLIYVNREEDLGIEGLRKAKSSYQPIRLEKKYCVNIEK